MRSDDEVESAEMQRLLQGLGSDAPAPAAAMRRVSEQLTASLALAAAATSAGVIGRRLAESSGASSASRWWGSSFRHAAVLHGAGIVAGGIAGALIHAAWQHPEVRVVYVDGVVEARAAVATQVEPDLAIAATPSTSSAPIDVDRAVPPARKIERRDGGAEERKALDAARRSLIQGDPTGCLQRLMGHARAFPNGKLAEERDAMWVNALVGTRAYEAARKKAESFRQAYPHSILASSVDAAIEAIP